MHSCREGRVGLRFVPEPRRGAVRTDDARARKPGRIQRSAQRQDVARVVRALVPQANEVGV